MPNLIQQLCKKQIIKTIPSFIPEGLQYLTIMGSIAYGCNEDNSDFDCYGFTMVPKELQFPHLAGEIEGFGKQKQRFEVWTQHHLYDASAQGGKGRDYDFSVYSIVKYFSLLIENNPNMLDSLFVPLRCILYTTPIGELVRENRRMFLHKGFYYKAKGYSYSQLHKMKIKDPPEGKRKESVDKFGYDVKYALHLVRLMRQAEQVLLEGDLDLEKNREELKSIRRGEWKLEQIEQLFADKERQLDDLYITSKIPHSPDESKIKTLLLTCLEQHFGSLSNCITKVDPAIEALSQIQDILHKYNLRKN